MIFFLFVLNALTAKYDVWELMTGINSNFTFIYFNLDMFDIKNLNLKLSIFVSFVFLNVKL